MQTPLVDAITNLCRVAWYTAKLDIGELVLSPEQSTKLSGEVIGPCPLPEGVDTAGFRISRFLNPITSTDIKITILGVD